MLKQLLVWLGSALLSAAGKSALVSVVDLDHYKIMIVTSERLRPEAIARMSAEIDVWLRGERRVCLLETSVTQIVFVKSEAKHA